MLTRTAIRERSAAGDDRIPLLTVGEFFAGNADEDSIAPNQVGDGRPELAEIAARLTALEADPAVAWVRVQLHEEMFEDGYDGVAAESVAICTELSDEDVDARLGDLAAEPVWEGLSYDEDEFCDQPAVPDGHRVVTLSWD
ncbi:MULTISPECIES: hypothetical protein [Amycolatopsis]|uniref:Uncharacterized protein n=1 Tax=Amycolatopsis dendrobii TaxID=2760662 RepID=A0A7W3VTA5_9PSEU|nr:MULTISPECIES: hypothetical protein [Amycolatopsis]MBB1152814.1 hypothetical protein [Amycolatopsis dendrobii]UKD52011.1 hypothetical protein L3Q65_29310 [Amycolatopsis sp. FU40]